MFARGVPGADSLALGQRVSTTRYDIHVDAPDNLFRAMNRITDVRTGGSVTLYRPRWTHEIGYELSSVQSSYYANGPAGFGDLIPLIHWSSADHTTSVYGDVLWRPLASLIINGGLPMDALDGGRGSVVLPRLSLKYFLTPDLAFIAATGRYAQWVHSLGREEELVQPFQFWVSSASAPSVSRDAILGLERWITPRRVFHAEAFHKRYERLLIPNSVHAFDVPGDEFVPVSGTSLHGADVLAPPPARRREVQRVAGVHVRRDHARGADGVDYYPTQDRRHNLNLVGSWRAGAYALGARVHLASGAPYTPIIGEFVRAVYDPAAKRWVFDNAQPPRQDIPGEFHSARVPFYHRVDASVRRNGHIRGASFAPYLSIVNLLNAKNPAGYIYSYNTNRPERSSFPNLPFAPTFGVSIGY